MTENHRKKWNLKFKVNIAKSGQFITALGCFVNFNFLFQISQIDFFSIFHEKAEKSWNVKIRNLYDEGDVSIHTQKCCVMLLRCALIGQEILKVFSTFSKIYFLHESIKNGQFIYQLSVRKFSSRISYFEQFFSFSQFYKN